ncbi:MAG: hypothetical protein J6B50_13000 [Lachnospiraceae bacterium]|nr:hypothetical protein [Lachnospiraceae bacterium]
MTVLTSRDKRLFSVLLQHPECIDWLGVASVFEGKATSGEYVDKAMQLIPQHSRAHYQLSEAVKSCLPLAKQIRYHWLVKALASILEPDDNGNSISPLLILSVSQYKNELVYAN